MQIISGTLSSVGASNAFDIGDLAVGGLVRSGFGGFEVIIARRPKSFRALLYPKLPMRRYRARRLAPALRGGYGRADLERASP
jgi:hypothetical protein